MPELWLLLPMCSQNDCSISFYSWLIQWTLFLACISPQATLQGKQAFIFSCAVPWLFGLSSPGLRCIFNIFSRADSPGTLVLIWQGRNNYTTEGHQPARHFNTPSRKRGMTLQQSHSGEESKSASKIQLLFNYY